MSTKNPLITLKVTMKSGVEFEVSGTLTDFHVLHKRFVKYKQGLRARTDDYSVLCFGSHLFVSDEVAAYSALSNAGLYITLPT